jgi:hypothetical protein
MGDYMYGLKLTIRLQRLFQNGYVLAVDFYLEAYNVPVPPASHHCVATPPP